MKSHDQMLVPGFVKPMLVSFMEMEKWITSKREDE